MAATVEGHYTSGRLGAAILGALREMGHDPDHLDPEALVPVAEFHTLGRVASVALAEAAGIGPGDHVLDVGCGIGGPARFLAHQVGCRVTGIDLTDEFCEVARDLNARTGLAERIEIHQGDALDLPFPDDSFDVAWTQHVAMNISDKAKLYQEMSRALRPGGRLALFDVVGGPAGPIHFPVPWAESPEISFLEPAEAIGQKIEAAGLKITHWEDLTADAIGFFTKLAAGGRAAQRSALGLHLVISNMGEKIGNARRNLEEDRMRLLRCVATA